MKKNTNKKSIITLAITALFCLGMALSAQASGTEMAAEQMMDEASASAVEAAEELTEEAEELTEEAEELTEEAAEEAADAAADAVKAVTH